MSPIQEAVKALGGPSAAGRAIGVSHEAVRRWAAGVNRVTAERAIQIERLTQGNVTAKQLRPDIFDVPPTPTRAEAA